MSVWSKEPPSEAGWYWVRRGPGGYANAVLVENDDNVLYAAGLYVRAYHADTEWQRIPSPAKLAAMEACVEALPIARKLLDDHLGIRETIEHAEKNPTDHWWQHDADQFRQIDAALAALDEAREDPQ